MKLDELVRRDAMLFDVDEWCCIIYLGDGTNALATLVNGEYMKDGSIRLTFEYTASATCTVMANEIAHVPKSEPARVIRENIFMPGINMLAGGRIEIDELIDPEDID